MYITGMFKINNIMNKKHNWESYSWYEIMPMPKDAYSQFYRMF